MGPAQVIATSPRPDIYLISVAIKILIIIDLTSPLEENMMYWRKTKSDKYECLNSNVYAGWKIIVFTIEAGAKGFVNIASFNKCFGKLGFPGNLKKNILDSISRTTVRCSYYIWLNRFNKNMSLVRLEKLNIDETLLDVKPIGISEDFVPPKPCCPVTRGRENAISFLDKPSISIKSAPINSLPVHEYSTTGDYLSGAFWALDAFNQCWSAFSATDLGQYPWGKNPKKGRLSEICDSLRIKTSDNVSNCCLFIHLLTAV